jgi:copper chaperone CopZ
VHAGSSRSRWFGYYTPVGYGPTEGTAVTHRVYTVVGMTCEHCVSAISSEVSGVEGVAAVDVDLGRGQMTVTGDGYTDDQIRAAVDEAGYELVDA